MAILTDVFKFLDCCDEDIYEIHGCGPDAPGDAQLRDFERRIGFSLPEDFRAFTRSPAGGLSLEVREHQWPRPKPFETGPAWSFMRSIAVFGFSPHIPKALDLRVQYEELRELGYGHLVPFLRVDLGSSVFCFERGESIVEWRSEDGSESVVDLDFATLLLRELHALEARRLRKASGEDRNVHWMKDPPDPTAELERVRAVLRGATAGPVDDEATVALRQMLEHGGGCDLRLSATDYEGCFAWQATRRKPMGGMATAVGELLRLAGAQAPTARVRAVIGPGTMAFSSGARWSFERRLLWIELSAGEVSIQVRSAGDTPAEEQSLTSFPRPVTFEPPPRPDIPSPDPKFVNYTSPRPCPHCRQDATRYRRLDAGPLVCLACGRSFDATPG